MVNNTCKMILFLFVLVFSLKSYAGGFELHSVNQNGTDNQVHSIHNSAEECKMALDILKAQQPERIFWCAK